MNTLFVHKGNSFFTGLHKSHKYTSTIDNLQITKMIITCHTLTINSGLRIINGNIVNYGYRQNACDNLRAGNIIYNLKLPITITI